MIFLFTVGQKDANQTQISKAHTHFRTFAHATTTIQQNDRVNANETGNKKNWTKLSERIRMNTMIALTIAFHWNDQGLYKVFQIDIFRMSIFGQFTLHNKAFERCLFDAHLVHNAHQKHFVLTKYHFDFRFIWTNKTRSARKFMIICAQKLLIFIPAFMIWLSCDRNMRRYFVWCVWM